MELTRHFGFFYKLDSWSSIIRNILAFFSITFFVHLFLFVKVLKVAFFVLLFAFPEARLRAMIGIERFFWNYVCAKLVRVLCTRLSMTNAGKISL